MPLVSCGGDTTEHVFPCEKMSLHLELTRTDLHNTWDIGLWIKICELYGCNERLRGGQAS